MLEPWNVFVGLMKANKRFIVLSSNSALGLPMTGEQAITGTGQNSQRLGEWVFNSWLNMRRYRLWRGLASRLNLIRKVVVLKM